MGDSQNSVFRQIQEKYAIPKVFTRCTAVMCATVYRTGIVGQYLLNPDPRDHHLNSKRVAPLYADALRRCLVPPASAMGQ
jgi:hypothetical protein